jgi:outer membrane biosynthesis protein TonB
MALDTSRVLRIGVVYRGQVVAERVLERRVDVTVGTQPGCTVDIPTAMAPDLKGSFPVAILHQNAYHVVLPSDPSHAINLRGGPGGQGVDKSAVVTVKGQKVLPIEAYTGGSLALGDLIVMFQFVRADLTHTVTKEEIVLRIGLVHEDRLLSDQIYPAGETVTIGTAATCTIALPDTEYQGPGARFTSTKGKTDFRAKLPKESDPKIALENGTAYDVAGAQKLGIATVDGDGIGLNLPLKSRGKAKLGQYTVLYQVVKRTIVVPVAPVKPLYQKLLAPFTNDTTWSVSFLVAFLLIGSFVGQALIFNRTTGRFLAKNATEEQETASIYEVQIEQKEEIKEEEPEKEDKPVADIMSDQAKKEAAKEDKVKEDKRAEKAASDKQPVKAESIGKQVDPEEAKKLAVESVSKKTIAGAFGGPGASTKLFAAGDDDGEGGEVVAKTFGGDGDGGAGATGPGGGGLKVATGGGGGGTIEKVSGKAGGGFKRDEGAAAPVKEEKKEAAAPQVKLSMGGLGGDGDEGEKSAVAKMVARKNSAVQKCYENELRDNDAAGGKVRVTFTVGPAGNVTDVSVSGASGGFADCIKNKFMAIRGLPASDGSKTYNQSYVFAKGG